MARRESQKAKILVLLEILIRESDQEHPLSVPRLLQRLEENNIAAERKSIYSDIQCLQDMGYQIELVRGPGGGYYLAEGTFELHELKLLVDAVQSSKFINETHSRTLIEKLMRLTSKYHAQDLRRQVKLAGRTKTPQNTQYALDTLHQAINQGKKVEFIYNEWDLDKKLVPRRKEKYHCSPAALAYENGLYYMVGRKTGEEQLKNFRVDKMTQVSVTQEKADSFPNQEINQYVARMFNMFGGDTTKVTLSAPLRLVGPMVDRFGTGPTFVREGEDAFHFTVPVTVSEQFFGWVCGFGGEIKILDPPDVREKYARHLEKLQESLRNY